MDFRIGHGYDVHALADGLPLVLGGVEIAHTKGCVAHSDGDVAIHALCDALLGAAALGDIGLHFPDTSADFAGIDSKILLRRVAELLREKGYEIGNVDCTIRAQQPRVAAAHRRHAPCDGRRNGRRRRPGVDQGHDHGASGLRGARGRHLRLRRGAYFPSCGREIIQNSQFRIQNCLYLYDQTPNRDAYEAVENNLSTPCLRAHDI